MDPNEHTTFRGEMPVAAERPLAVGQTAYDEGVYVCDRCKLPGAEISLMPGDAAPDCPGCGADARWVKT